MEPVAQATSDAHAQIPIKAFGVAPGDVSSYFVASSIVIPSSYTVTTQQQDVTGEK